MRRKLEEKNYVVRELCVHANYRTMRTAYLYTKEISHTWNTMHLTNSTFPTRKSSGPSHAH